MRKSLKRLTRIIELASAPRGAYSEVVVASNGSTDRTLEVASQMAAACHQRVRVIHTDEKGPRRALRKARLENSAHIVSYMDGDLSTDLKAFLQLIEPLLAGQYDVGVGSRLLCPAWTRRGFRREWISRFCNRQIALGQHE